MLVAASRFAAHHPHPHIGAANVVTSGRLALVALLAAALGEDASAALAWAATALTLLTSALDGLDGWLARRSSLASAFGARFDMETDALLILVLSVLVWRWDKAGWWVLLSGAMRYAFVAAGFVLPWMNGRLAPTLRAKTVAVIQMVALIVAIGPVIPVPLSTFAAAAGLLLLMWSFAIDVGRLWSARRDLTAS